MQLVAQQKDVFEGQAQEDSGDINAMLADVNSLPADDPLRQDSAGKAQGSQQSAAAMAAHGTVATALLPAGIVKDFNANGGPTAMPVQTATYVPPPTEAERVQSALRSHGGVVVGSGPRVSVPVFVGAALRSVVERAGAAGLRVQPVGSGLAREQMPAAGTIVPAGTEITVRFTR